MKKIITLFLVAVFAFSGTPLCYADDSNDETDLSVPSTLIIVDGMNANEVVDEHRLSGANQSEVEIVSDYLISRFDTTEMGKLIISNFTSTRDSLSFSIFKFSAIETNSCVELVQGVSTDRVTLFRDRSSVSSNKSDNWGQYDIACTLTAYYTIFYDDIFDVSVTLHYSTFSYHKYNISPYGPYGVANVYMWILGDLADGSLEVFREQTLNSPTADYTYYLQSYDTRRYKISSPVEVLVTGSIITLSDSSSSGGNSPYIDLLASAPVY